MPRYRKPPRLKGFDYRGPLAAHLTFVTRGRHGFFRDAQISSACLDVLHQVAAKFSSALLAYCLMPDHVQSWLKLPKVSLEDFVHQFKQLSAFRMKKKSSSFGWQVSYYDQVLRSDEELKDVARYVCDNPVKAGLVSSWFDYPFPDRKRCCRLNWESLQGS